MRHSYLLFAAASAAVLLLSGCARDEAAEPHAGPALPQVTVAAAISRKVTEFDEFTGRFEAVERVEIRPRVSGYISSVNFKEGSEVRKGDVLFVIDPRPYEAELRQAQAQLAQARSQLILASPSGSGRRSSCARMPSPRRSTTPVRPGSSRRRRMWRPRRPRSMPRR